MLRREGDGFPPEAVGGVRLITFAAQRGVSPEAVAASSAEQGDVPGER